MGQRNIGYNFDLFFNRLKIINPSDNADMSNDKEKIFSPKTYGIIFNLRFLRKKLMNKKNLDKTI